MKLEFDIFVVNGRGKASSLPTSHSKCSEKIFEKRIHEKPLKLCNGEMKLLWMSLFCGGGVIDERE